MKEKILAAITAGVLTTALMTGTVFAADTEVQGDKELKGGLRIYRSQPQQLHGRDPEGFQ